MITQEIGSLAKPNWRVKFIRGESLLESDLGELRYWDEVLGLKFDLSLLKKRGEGSIRKAVEHSALQAIRLLEKAGLDVVFDGEQFRTEMYEYPLKHVKGFEFVGLVRSFDNKYYRKAACVNVPELREPYHLEEFLFVKRHTRRKIKIPITGPYTLAEWSFNEYYVEKHGRGYDAKREFVLDIAKNVIRPNLETLIEEGAEIIQIDEPALTTKPDEIPIFVEAFNDMISGLECKFNVHICYSDYSVLFPDILELKNCNQLALEFANRDDERRSGYDLLKTLRDYSYEWELGLGVVDVHTDFIEPPELIRDRILYATKFLDPRKIVVNPDCGLRTRTWDVAFAKLRNMVKGTRMAEEVLRFA